MFSQIIMHERNFLNFLKLTLLPSTKTTLFNKYFFRKKKEVKTSKRDDRSVVLATVIIDTEKWKCN